ncbi:extensin family protein [Kaistia sp. MMO-174]|uniref:extensin family protein n=1 Tax=Kaistia sp. MMO-174 TaxID=3081256 RepID=UPI00301AFF60
MLIAKRTGTAMAGLRVLTFGMGGLLAALLVGAAPFEARAITADELFQKVIPKVDGSSARKPAKRKPHKAMPASLPAKAAVVPTVDSAAAAAAPAAPADTPLPTRRPAESAEPATTPPPVAVAPLPREKPAEERKAAGLIAIPAPAEATVGTVRTVPVPADPALAAGALAAASALAGAVPADPPTEEQLAFAPPVLPTLLKPTPAEGRNDDGSLKKGDRLPPPEKQAGLAPTDTKPIDHPSEEKSLVAEAPPPSSLPMPRRKPEIMLAALAPRIIPALPELAACKALLSGLKISAKALPAIEAGQCGGPDPFDVTALEGGKVDLEPAAKINCAMATTLAHWVDEDIQPSAEATLGGRVTALRVADSYSCRGRNQIATAMLSEHAFLNAVDIAAFQVNGRWVTVKKTEGRTEKEDSFLKAARVSACDKFNTVLGPGSDGYHEDHYHLDLRQRGKGGGKKYCH